MKAKPFYKNNKHNNNMDSKEKENINEEELKAQAVPEENGEEATEKEEVTPTEEEKLAQELEKAHAEIDCAYSRSVLPEGVGLLSSSAVQEPDSLSSQHSPEMTSQPADLSISDFSPSVLSGEVGGQAECALSVLPVGLDREQLILINDNPDVVQIAELSFAEEGAGMVLRLAFVGEGKAQITVQSADGKSCSMLYFVKYFSLIIFN